jgi:hypothetical protein
MLTTKILSHLDAKTSKLSKKKYSETYKIIKNELEKIQNSFKQNKVLYKNFEEFLKYLTHNFKINENDYENASRSNLERDEIFLKREANAININSYNKIWLKTLKANLDIQFCLHPYACVKYR